MEKGVNGYVNILIITDAWYPQINGVVRTLSKISDELKQLGHRVEIIGPEKFRTIPLPSYPEIRLAVWAGRRLPKMIDALNPDAIHIATEGPLGHVARRYCMKRNRPFTSAYHTRFPEYIRNRAPIPLSFSYALVRRFHRPSAAVMVSTRSIEQLLQERGLKNIKPWTRGVDTDLFYPRDKSFIQDVRPIALYVGRISVEKNLPAFLDMPFEGSKYVVGGGPQLAEFKQKYPHIHFTGVKQGKELAQYYAAADVFVFPSKTDTFGLVLLEALASGIPVAAYPVPGPLDVLGGSEVAVLNMDLAKAAQEALHIPSQRCRQFALRFSWRVVAEQFLHNLQPFYQS